MRTDGTQISNEAISTFREYIAKNYGKGLIAEDIVKGIPSALKRLKNGRFIN